MRKKNGQLGERLKGYRKGPKETTLIRPRTMIPPFGCEGKWSKKEKGGEFREGVSKGTPETEEKWRGAWKSLSDF